MSMKQATFESGQVVSANDLSYGMLRSNKYFCLFCGNNVSYISSTSNKVAHFRHRPDESCINEYSQKDIDEQTELRAANIKSTFHKSWQAMFGSKQTEVHIQQGNKLHIADIHLTFGAYPLQIKLDNGEDLFQEPVHNLVIEIQHSIILACDAKHRDSFYNINNKLLWIFDISHILHQVDQITTLTQDIVRILFPREQHKGLVNVLQNCVKSIVLVDTGKYLFHVKKANIDVGFMNVAPLSKASFLEQLYSWGALEIKRCHDLFTYEYILDIANARNYKEFIEALDENYQSRINGMFNMMEDMPISYFRNICKTLKYDGGYVHMIATWLGYISDHHVLVFKMFMKWINHTKETYYKERLTFGRYQGSPLCDIPNSYLAWLLKEEVLESDLLLKEKVVELVGMNCAAASKPFYDKNPNVNQDHIRMIDEVYLGASCDYVSHAT